MSINGFKVNGTVHKYNYPALDNISVARSDISDAALSDFAGVYSSSSTYLAGDYVFYNNALYRCNTDITTAENWTAAHWEQITLGNDVTDLKNELKQDELAPGLISRFINFVLNTTEQIDSDFPIVSFEQGGFADGVNYVRINRIRSPYIPVAYYSSVTFTVANGYNIYVESYNINREYMSDTGWRSGPTVTVPRSSNVAYWRICVRHSDNTSAIIPSEASNITAVASHNELQLKVSQATNPSDIHSGQFLLNRFIFVFSPTTVRNELPAPFATVSNFYIGCFATPDAGLVTQIVFSGYCPRLFSRVVSSSSGDVVRDWYEICNIGSPTNKWYVLGDSISAGYYSITDAEATEKGVTISYRPDGLSGVGAVWDSSLAHNYWGYANDWFVKRTLVGKAYPGQGYFRTAANNQNGIYVVKNTDFSDAGLITVAWGFNDWHYNQVRGNHTLIDPAVKYPTAGYDTTQLTTVNHAIWYCLGELIRKAPQAKIVVQTPMNGWLYGGDFDTNWSIGYSLSNSGTLADIHDDIVYWANYYGLQIMDMTYNNSIVNRLNIKDALIDGSHPTDQAHMQLGRTVGHELLYG